LKGRQAQPPETIAVITNVSILTEMLSDSEAASAAAVATGDVPAVSVDGEQGDCQCSGPPSESPAADVFAPAGAAAGNRPDDAQGQQPMEPILARPSLGLGVALIAKIGVRSQNAVAVAVTRGLF
jgi:hypothetical protein